MKFMLLKMEVFGGICVSQAFNWILMAVVTSKEL